MISIRVLLLSDRSRPIIVPHYAIDPPISTRNYIARSNHRGIYQEEHAQTPGYVKGLRFPWNTRAGEWETHVYARVMSSHPLLAVHFLSSKVKRLSGASGSNEDSKLERVSTGLLIAFFYYYSLRPWVGPCSPLLPCCSNFLNVEACRFFEILRKLEKCARFFEDWNYYTVDCAIVKLL